MQIEPSDQPSLDFYQDLHGLESIKQNPDSAEALQGVARQFEVQFLKEVLHQMREATDVMAGDDSLVSSDSVRFYQEMCDSQLAMAMAGQNKTGLQDKIIDQMSHLLPDAAPTGKTDEKLKRSS
ncbi:flagellar protein FlgJ [Aeromonas sp. RU39B]|jgi:flagellar protein FlgJ|uniref:rod-binding protein n=1 Tax=Aeromonas sp. RU39B TaxID=1907416 RepID=UPI000955CF40|nr:rod-binding protein [Aeromonas sp. RU39B]SIR16950.1 flagellar protein FlgJ [Aeromonas sp. RU39B]